MNSRNQFKFHKDAFLEYRFLGFSRSEELPANSPQSVCCRPYQARYAIFLCLRELGFSNEDEVLAPSYICAAAVDPIRAYGCKPVFYPVTAECSSNLAEIENRIGPRTRALLVVHYFGFANRCLRQLRDLCDRRNLVLIEDCAHVLSGEVQGVRLGQMGDVAVFSFRKFLPVPDGAGLQFNRREASLAATFQRESFASTLKHWGNMAEQRWPGLQPLSGPVSRAAQSLRWPSLASDRSPRQKHSEFPDGETFFDCRRLHSAMSPVSAWVISHTRIQRVVERRRENYLKLSARLGEIPGVELLFPKLPPTICPWILPLRLEGYPFAHRTLRECGIPAVAWDAVRPPEVKGAEFPDADFLYENLFFLPVHRSLTAHDIEEMVSAVTLVNRCGQGRRQVCAAG